MNQGEMPAYPCIRQEYGESNTFQAHHSGLTKREAFAMAVMQGILANSGGPVQASSLSGWQSTTNCSRHDVACEAVAFADALLAALSDQPTRQEE